MAEFHIEIDSSQLTEAIEKLEDNLGFWELVIPLMVNDPSEAETNT